VAIIVSTVRAVKYPAGRSGDVKKQTMRLLVVVDLLLFLCVFWPIITRA
jgi:hypothetical protein